MRMITMDKEAFRQIRDWLGITYREDKPAVVRDLRKLTAEGVYSRDLYSDLK